MKLHERVSGMIEGLGRMQPVGPAVTETQTGTQARGGEAVKAGAGVPKEARAADLSMGRMASEMAAAPPVDMARVAALREAIAEGRYKADPEAIAGAMIAQAGEGR
jgi:negative regulator of flagellin synthesis FlgM